MNEFRQNSENEIISCPTSLSQQIGYICPSIDFNQDSPVIVSSVRNGVEVFSIVSGRNSIRTFFPKNSSIWICVVFGIQFLIDLVLWIRRGRNFALLPVSLAPLLYYSRHFWQKNFSLLSVAWFDFESLSLLGVGILLLARLVWFMSTHPRLAFLAKTIGIGLGDIVQFLFILLAVYALLAVLGHVFLGDRIAGFGESFPSSLWLQFQYLLAQWDFANLRSLVPNKVVLFLYLLLFQLVFLLLIMNVFLAVLIAAFDQASRSNTHGAKNLVADGFWVCVEFWKAYKEGWPSRKAVLANEHLSGEGWEKMQAFYNRNFPPQSIASIETRFAQLESLVAGRQKVTSDMDQCISFRKTIGHSSKEKEKKRVKKPEKEAHSPNRIVEMPNRTGADSIMFETRN